MNIQFEFMFIKHHYYSLIFLVEVQKVPLQREKLIRGRGPNAALTGIDLIKHLHY